MQTTTLSFRNMHVHGELFTDILRARRESFIVQRKWDLPEVDGMEFDQYDTPQSRWIAVHHLGDVLAGIRLTPTTARCGIYTYMIRDAQLGLLEFDSLRPPLRGGAGRSLHLGSQPRVHFEHRSRNRTDARPDPADGTDGADRAGRRRDPASGPVPASLDALDAAARLCDRTCRALPRHRWLGQSGDPDAAPVEPALMGGRPSRFSAVWHGRRVHAWPTCSTAFRWRSRARTSGRWRTESGRRGWTPSLASATFSDLAVPWARCCGEGGCPR